MKKVDPEVKEPPAARASPVAADLGTRIDYHGMDQHDRIECDNGECGRKECGGSQSGRG